MKKEKKTKLLRIILCILLVIIIFYSSYYFIVLSKFNLNFNTLNSKNNIHNSKWGTGYTLSKWEQECKEIISLSPKMNLKKNDIVYEIGCGTCAFLDILKNMEPSITLKGNDIVENPLNECKKKYPKQNFYLDDMLNIPDKIIGKVDHIVANGVICYMSSIEKVVETLEKCYRILKPGGTMRFTMLDNEINLRNLLLFKVQRSSCNLRFEKKTFENFASKYNLECKIYNNNVMNGKRGSRFIVVYKK